ncbi:hypothetical protein [Polaribacter ponticola]|uniref:DinB family protein n=1 Tax=Polaribacter ponticola TaxID=2978475 RepID=A0ABT5SAX4_9FLAO|nr:hypothetical protein [Polaribacter sp. MSW5]MDD7914447.1 hypothetical protein [Polaribacter sp. MSW5]
MKNFIFLIALIIFFTMNSQEKLPCYEIPKMQENYSAPNTVARMIDGLGFRYFWSTQGLRAEDLAYQPKGDGRNCQQTVIHLYDLSNMMLRLTNTNFIQVKGKSEMLFSEMRKQTLLNLEALSKKIKKNKDLSEFSSKKDGKVSIPFFNLINGPIADAIWHTGQVASFRRSSGNPISSKINHFSGTVKE